MSAEFVSKLKSGLDFAFALSEKFLSICPDDVWQKKFGGWPVSRQFYHAIDVTGFFTTAISAEVPANPCPGGGELANDGGPLATREQAGEFLGSVRAAVDKMAAGLVDADLLRKNESASQMFGRDFSNAEVIQIMGAHVLYHLGSCDAALREQGLEGAF